MADSSPMKHKTPDEVIDAARRDLVRALAAIEDPTDRYRACEAAMNGLRSAIGEVATIPRQTVRDLRTQGWKLQEIADAWGISRQRVAQIESA